MKKLIGTLSLFVVLAICACNQNSETSTPPPPPEVPAAVEAPVAPPAPEVQYVEHVCSDKCTPEGCYHAHGENGHTCDDNCHAGHNH